MSNFHKFGNGKVEMCSGIDSNGDLVVALSDIDVAMPMDVPYTVKAVNFLHSTVMTFPTKAALNRYITFLQESAEMDGLK